MKINKLFIVGLSLLAVACGKQELPYDLDGVTKSVAINVAKVVGSDLILSQGTTTGSYKLNLTIPANQGNYEEYFKEAQVRCVYTPATGDVQTFLTANPAIATFPTEVTIDLDAVCTQAGLTGGPNLGDRFQFTVDVVRKDGKTFPGWNEYSGFNNEMISYLGTAYSAKASYTAFAPFNEAKFNGNCYAYEKGAYAGGWNSSVTRLAASDLPDATLIPEGIEGSDLLGLQWADDFWFGGDVIKIWINTKDYTLIIPDQVLVKDWVYPGEGTHDAYATRCYGEVDTLNDLLTFYFYSSWGRYTFGDATYVLDFHAN